MNSGPAGFVQSAMRAYLVLCLLALPALAEWFEWQVILSKDYTIHDSLPLQAYLRNAGAEATPPDSLPSVVLLADGKEVARKEVARQDHRSGQAKVAPNGVAFGLDADLRALFGRFKAGRYAVKVEQPEGPSSASIEFTVVGATLEEARKQQEDADPAVDLKVAGIVAVLTNNEAKSVAFYAYEGKEPLSSLLACERWHPRFGWIPTEPGLCCGTGLKETPLRPGESVKLALPPAVDGIVRYVLHCWDPADEKRSSVVARTPPFLRDTLPPVSAPAGDGS
ncbi:MAG: hypothetical protein ACREID_05765 [Planctomycetota bacterium]